MTITMTNDDLKEDEIYVGYLSGGDRYIFTAFKGGGYKNYIECEYNTFYDNFKDANHKWSKLEEATEQEKRHLRACIKAGKFVECSIDQISEDFQYC